MTLLKCEDYVHGRVCGTEFEATGNDRITNAWGEVITCCPECMEFWRESHAFHAELVSAIREGIGDPVIARASEIMRGGDEV